MNPSTEALHHSADVSAGETVLVVDDEPGVCQALAKVLREEGYRVVCATSGEEGLEVAGGFHPRLILLDIVMPGMDGIAMLRALREQGQQAVVIMLTARGTIQTAREAMALGAHDYITKPFNLQFLKSVLRDAMRGAAARTPASC